MLEMKEKPNAMGKERKQGNKVAQLKKVCTYNSLMPFSFDETRYIFMYVRYKYIVVCGQTWNETGMRMTHIWSNDVLYSCCPDKFNIQNECRINYCSLPVGYCDIVL